MTEPPPSSAINLPGWVQWIVRHRRIILSTLFLALAVAWQRHEWVRLSRPQPRQLWDFSQEWLSARNYRAGIPVYSPQLVTVPIHTGFHPLRPDDMLPWNAHPPVTVLLVLPLGHLDYEDAHLIWNLAMIPLFFGSVWLVLRLRQVPLCLSTIFTILALSLISFPLKTQFMHGQLSILLLFLIVLAWWADRREWDWLAGACIGAAASVKLFPGFLIIYWLVRGRWKAVVGAAATFGTLNGIALAVFGIEAFETYYKVVVPSVVEYRSSWFNESLSGFWLKLFDPKDFEKVFPLYRSPQLAEGLVMASQVIVALLVGYRCWRATTRDERDRAVGLAIVGLMLISPIVWNHYFVLLVPVFVILEQAQMPKPLRRGFRLTEFILWVPPAWFLIFTMKLEALELANVFGQRKELPWATPRQVLVSLAVPFYALLFLFYLSARPQKSVPRTM